MQYLIRFAVYKIHQNIHEKDVIQASLLLILCLIKNEHMQLLNYAHEIMPVILNTLLLDDIGVPDTNDHLDIRHPNFILLNILINKSY